jgi:hypothetical protein
VTREPGLLIGGLVVGVLAIWVAFAALIIPAATGSDDVAMASVKPSASPAGGALVGGATVAPDGSGTLTAAPSADSATPDRPTDPSPTSRPTVVPTRTPRPPAPSGEARLLYAEFLTRLDDDRATVGPLNAALTSAAQTGDKPAVRETAVDILQFADGERDWLLGHPPADCYATAHDAAGSMLEAYATVADRAIEWTNRTGFAALQALARVAEAADDAQAELARLAEALETTSCA